MGRLNSGPLRYAILTHWHWDHADGDGWVRRRGAQLMATRETIERLSQTLRVEEWGHTFTPVPEADLPNVRIEGETTLTFGGETVVIRPYAHSHTDGDLLVYFKQADVLQTGDTFWNGMYPFIDGSSGGTLDGFIAAVDRTLAMTDENTRIIPGHGPLGTRRDLVEYRDMLVIVRDRIVKLVRAGRTQEQVIAAKPTAEFDAKWGGRFWKPEQWVGQLYVLVKQAD